MRRTPHPQSIVSPPRRPLRPGEATSARERGTRSPPRRVVSGKARELNYLVWIDLIVIGVLVLLLALAKASL